MARYIDAGVLVRTVKEHLDEIAEESGKSDNPVIMGYLLAKNHVIDIIAVAPTADVAPKSEVASEIIYDLEKKLHTMLPFKTLSLINGEQLGNSFDLGKERTIYDILNCLNDLKKKYTEEKECGIYDMEEDAAKFINGTIIPCYNQYDIEEWLKREVEE